MGTRDSWLETGGIAQQEETDREMVQSNVEERGGGAGREEASLDLMPSESCRRASQHPSILQ